MLLLKCPCCGERPETEFMVLGEALRPRPRDPSALSDAEWADYINARRNIRGRHEERWWHFRSCSVIFTITRDTVTHRIFESPEGAAP